MPDWDGKAFSPSHTISSFESKHRTNYACCGQPSVAAIWPTANRGYYVPFWIEEIVTVYQLAIIVAVAAGNVDVGIYDENGNAIVTNGAVATGAAGLQVFNITDTVLKPGAYFFGMYCSSVTASFQRGASTGSNGWMQALGVQQQALSTALPTPTATFANATTPYIPLIYAVCRQAVM